MEKEWKTMPWPLAQLTHPCDQMTPPHPRRHCALRVSSFLRSCAPACGEEPAAPAGSTRHHRHREDAGGLRTPGTCRGLECGRGRGWSGSAPPSASSQQAAGPLVLLPATCVPLVWELCVSCLCSPSSFWHREPRSPPGDGAMGPDHTEWSEALGLHALASPPGGGNAPRFAS